MYKEAHKTNGGVFCKSVSFLDLYPFRPGNYSKILLEDHHVLKKLLVGQFWLYKVYQMCENLYMLLTKIPLLSHPQRGGLYRRVCLSVLGPSVARV